MEKSVNSVISKLKVLSKVQSGQKLLMDDNNFTVIEKKYHWERFIKWWLGENRYATTNKLDGFYMEINQLVTRMIENYDDSKDKMVLERLKNELAGSLNGLSNLVNTYQHDQTVTSKLETVSENLTLEMKKIDEFLKRDDQTNGFASF